MVRCVSGVWIFVIVIDDGTAGIFTNATMLMIDDGCEKDRKEGERSNTTGDLG
jgi:hypothetical protein